MAPITAPTNSFCKSGLAEDWRRIAPRELVGRLPKPYAPTCGRTRHLVGQAVPGDGPHVGRCLRPPRRDRIREDQRMTGPEARQLGLGRALQEFEALLATWCVDEQPDDLDALAVYEKPAPGTHPSPPSTGATAGSRFAETRLIEDLLALLPGYQVDEFLCQVGVLGTLEHRDRVGVHCICGLRELDRRHLVARAGAPLKADAIKQVDVAGDQAQA